jgi:hypothetical protein
MSLIFVRFLSFGISFIHQIPSSFFRSSPSFLVAASSITRLFTGNCWGIRNWEAIRVQAELGNKIRGTEGQDSSRRAFLPKKPTLSLLLVQKVTRVSFGFDWSKIYSFPLQHLVKYAIKTRSTPRSFHQSTKTPPALYNPEFIFSKSNMLLSWNKTTYLGIR